MVKQFGNVVTENAIDIDGYNKVDPTSANINNNNRNK